VSQNLNMLRMGRAIARWRNVVSVCVDSRMGTEIRLLLGRYTIHGDRYTICDRYTIRYTIHGLIDTRFTDSRPVGCT